MARIKDWIMEMEAHVYTAMDLGLPRDAIWPYVRSHMSNASKGEVEQIIEAMLNHYYGFTFNEKGEVNAAQV